MNRNVDFVFLGSIKLEKHKPLLMFQDFHFFFLSEFSLPTIHESLDYSRGVRAFP